ncbi:MULTISPECIES: class I SAM-dependent methyltransferase [unclassified Lysobacter]
MALHTEQGAGIYSPATLKLYDWWVLGISNRHAWECSTDSVLLPFFRQRVGVRHLDVGVGTGFYPANAQLPESTQLTLMDLNASSLEAARRRWGRAHTEVIQHDAMMPLVEPPGEAFDSVSMLYLLHCLPRPMAEKSRVFANLKPHLKSDGVLFGATILGESAHHNSFGRALMNVYNRKGIFSNQNDTVGGLEMALRRHFAWVKTSVEGKVALFEARQPIFQGRAAPNDALVSSGTIVQ